MSLGDAANAVLSVLNAPRHSSVFSLTLLADGGHSVAHVLRLPDDGSMRIAWKRLIVKDVDSLLRMLTATGVTVIDVVDGVMTAFDPLCARRAMQDEHEMRVQALRKAWAAEELERYQRRREKVGLPRLAPGAKRSVWDEEMRVKYRELYGPHAYADERKRDLDDNRQREEQWSRQADQEIESKRMEAARSLVDVPEQLVLLSCSLTVIQRACGFVADAMTAAHHVLVLEDALNGQRWQVFANGVMQMLPHHLVTARMLFPFAGLTHRVDDVVRDDAMLKSLVLPDVDLEVAAYRFACSKTFIQNTFNKGMNLEDVLYLDMNGDTFGRPALFVLAQILIHMHMEVEKGDSADVVPFTNAMHFYSIWKEFCSAHVPVLTSCTWHGCALVCFIHVVRTKYRELGLLPQDDTMNLYDDFDVNVVPCDVPLHGPLM